MAGEFPTPDMVLTHILVVSDPQVSIAWYRDVLGAELYRGYGKSAVFTFNGAWLLVVKGGEPTEDKPGISMTALTALYVPLCAGCREVGRFEGRWVRSKAYSRNG